MKTYVIHNKEELRLVITTDIIADVTCNVAEGEYFQEVESGFRLRDSKLVEGEVVPKTLTELQESYMGN